MFERECEKWQKAIREVFPEVIVLPNDRVPNPPDMPPMLDVFFVPDERVSEFMDFLIDGTLALEEKYRLPEVHLMPHYTSATYEHYPHAVEAKAAVGAA